ncbi:MAG: single-stranded DNA-binding protein [Candidatus Thorarchaeota archaeon]|jgi:replication factor A1
MGYQEREPIEAVISELKPRMKSVNITFKVIAKGEIREVTSRQDGEQHRVCDTVVGDSSGKVTVPLWDASIEEVEDEKTYRLENGYTTLFQGHLRLNIGRYGKLNPADEEIAEINDELDMSEEEHERRPRYGGGRGRDRRGGGGGYRDRDSRGSGRDHSRGY